MKGVKTSAKKRQQVINLKKQGKTYKDIFLISGVSYTNISRITREAGVK